MCAAELELLREGEVVRVVAIGLDPIRIGRALDNTVVLVDDEVSGYHAVVTPRAEGLQVVDLRSTNGTFVNGERVTEATLADGDTIRLGPERTLRVRAVPEALSAPPVLVDMTAGTVHVLYDATARIGSDEACEVRLPGGPARQAVVTAAGRELWIEDDAGGRALAFGEVFRVGDHDLRVDNATLNTTPTLSHEPRAPSCSLLVRLDAPGGPVATLRNVRDAREHTVTGETRATLLYVLAQRRRADLDSGMPEAAAGWIDDESVLVAVWGRQGMRQAASNYSVLLHRLRRELEDAGFDATFLEKRRGATRLRLDAVELGVGEV